MNREILKQIAESNQTPCYVFDLDMLQKRMEQIKAVLGERTEVCYAMKANPFLTEPLKEIADSFEVCSPGEFKICEKYEIPREKIVLSGVYKNPEDMEYCIQHYGAAGVFTIESERQLDVLQETACKHGLQIRALLRVTSGNQFGIDAEDVKRMIQTRTDSPNVKIVGLQWYSGTQKKKLSKIQKELEKLDALLEELEQHSGYCAEVLEYGPGFFVPYFQGESGFDSGKDKTEKKMPETGTDWKKPDGPEELSAFKELLKAMKFQGRIVLEMGRYIAAECGYYLTRIVDQKTNNGQNYCIVDGGIHHLNYYGQTMAMKVPFYQHFKSTLAADENAAGISSEMCVYDKKVNTEKEENTEEIPWNICGSLCTVSDVIVKQLKLKNAQTGDVLVFERVGAYSVTEGIYLFLSRDLPSVLLYSEEAGIRTVRGIMPSYVINS